MKISLRPLNGSEPCNINCDEDETIEQLKDKISELTSIPVKQQRLVLNGKIVSSGTLGSNDIQEGMIIHIMEKPEDEPDLPHQEQEPRHLYESEDARPDPTLSTDFDMETMQTSFTIPSRNGTVTHLYFGGFPSSQPQNISTNSAMGDVMNQWMEMLFGPSVNLSQSNTSSRRQSGSNHANARNSSNRSSDSSTQPSQASTSSNSQNQSNSHSRSHSSARIRLHSHSRTNSPHSTTTAETRTQNNTSNNVQSRSHESSTTTPNAVTTSTREAPSISAAPTAPASAPTASASASTASASVPVSTQAVAAARQSAHPIETASSSSNRTSASNASHIVENILATSRYGPLPPSWRARNIRAGLRTLLREISGRSQSERREEGRDEAHRSESQVSPHSPQGEASRQSTLSSIISAPPVEASRQTVTSSLLPAPIRDLWPRTFSELPSADSHDSSSSDASNLSAQLPPNINFQTSSAADNSQLAASADHPSSRPTMRIESNGRLTNITTFEYRPNLTLTNQTASVDCTQPPSSTITLTEAASPSPMPSTMPSPISLPIPSTTIPSYPSGSISIGAEAPAISSFTFGSMPPQVVPLSISSQANQCQTEVPVESSNPLLPSPSPSLCSYCQSGLSCPICTALLSLSRLTHSHCCEQHNCEQCCEGECACGRVHSPHQHRHHRHRHHHHHHHDEHPKQLHSHSHGHHKSRQDVQDDDDDESNSSVEHSSREHPSSHSHHHENHKHCSHHHHHH
ncbi:putative Ubiquitin family [Monocercomonoides exilis]|uniref:putative Ubiquitin family n=1 Tax=Monocercomonoides exilis TaxID=2049356 RepID=UPI003559521E|nr:putative Ubiquitin family [Monocercomonoides exilis]|eukprot:MONOS_4445.1-p1 / transcript=MONOS_4445.1 / gene=MONOS_4445 / organism=Monocercomonoides_exilis_PA203 / gene_product=unspecified product / transcript_product=unspecified product / location=Mono_scaffold00118:41366-43600(-) / protein_length=744 / sequence_SO=supercontig / SO=protein_coding / is_pseudo=false